MYQRDYILRMIEMLADLIAGILGLIKKGNFEEATQALDNAYRDFLKEDASLFQILPKERLTKELLQVHNYTSGHLEILAELFYAQAELYFTQGKTAESLGFYEKSLLLLEFIIRENQVFSIEKQTRISQLKLRITELQKDM